MALIDNLKVFNNQVYSVATEVLTQQVNLFNAASNGAIILRNNPTPGDFSELAMWAKISGLVRRRDPYATGAVSHVQLQHLLDRSVKIGSGTPPVDIPPFMMEWIGRSPDEPAVVMGRQLAGDMLQDMLNVALLALAGAIGNVGSGVTYDGTSAVVDQAALLAATAKFGDQYNRLACWVMHSKSMFDLFGEALANAEGLFSYETVNIKRDALGRTFIITDSDSLKYTSSGQKYRVLGLTPGAALIDRNNDFFSNVETTNGDENILRTYQAEWSYNLGLKGFAWDATNGGKAPTNAELGTGTNWDKYATDNKDTAGVLINCQ